MRRFLTEFFRSVFQKMDCFGTECFQNRDFVNIDSTVIGKNTYYKFFKNFFRFIFH